MRKLFVLMVGVLLIANLSALTLGVGLGVEDLGNDAYLQIKGDATFSIVNFLDYRANFLLFNFKNKELSLGTDLDNDVIIKTPVPFMFQVYIPFGISISINDVKSFGIKAGAGLEKEFGFLKGYLEGGLRYFKIDEEDKIRFYLQGGIRLPLEIM